MIISTDLQLLISPMQWDQVASEIAQQLSAAGYNVTDIRAEVIDLTCEPDNRGCGRFESVRLFVCGGLGLQVVRESVGVSHG
ncbi:hypothetical protein I4J40_09735 [Corynebacterium belfantii]|nr:hypothetical protein [Corynebacterium belfantii]